TCLEAAKAGYPKILRGYTLTPLAGQSLLPIFQGRSRQRGAIFWEHEGNRAVRDGKWKLVSRFPGKWELYDLEADRTEMNDLAAKFPVIAEDLSRQYEAWAKRSNVEQWRR
ncbi:MAG: arylsulfatase, partial [Planctomycetota bacterium]